MQCSFCTSPSSNDEAVCLVDSVESHVLKEDDSRNIDIGIVRASNASEPSLQKRASACWVLNLRKQILAVAVDLFHADACSVVSSRTSC